MYQKCIQWVWRAIAAALTYADSLFDAVGASYVFIVSSFVILSVLIRTFFRVVVGPKLDAAVEHAWKSRRAGKPGNTIPPDAHNQRRISGPL